MLPRDPRITQTQQGKKNPTRKGVAVASRRTSTRSHQCPKKRKGVNEETGVSLWRSARCLGHSKRTTTEQLLLGKRAPRHQLKASQYEINCWGGQHRSQKRPPPNGGKRQKRLNDAETPGKTNIQGECPSSTGGNETLQQKKGQTKKKKKRGSSDSKLLEKANETISQG